MTDKLLLLIFQQMELSNLNNIVETIIRVFVIVEIPQKLYVCQAGHWQTYNFWGISTIKVTKLKWPMGWIERGCQYQVEVSVMY